MIEWGRVVSRLRRAGELDVSTPIAPEAHPDLLVVWKKITTPEFIHDIEQLLDRALAMLARKTTPPERDLAEEARRQSLLVQEGPDEDEALDFIWKHADTSV